MVKYALHCDVCLAEFDGWFSSSAAYDEQREAALVICPNCGSPSVSKQIMAPSVRDSKSVPKQVSEGAQKFVAMAKAVREHVADTHEYVGKDFAETARAMHYGEAEEKPVWGETTLSEAKSLAEDGVPALPLPEPMAPKKPVDQKKLN